MEIYSIQWYSLGNPVSMFLEEAIVTFYRKTRLHEMDIKNIEKLN